MRGNSLPCIRHTDGKSAKRRSCDVWRARGRLSVQTALQHSVLQNLGELPAYRTREPILRATIGPSAACYVRRVVAMGILLPIHKQSATSSNAIRKLSHRRGARWSHSAQWRGTESAMKCVHAAHQSIDGHYPPHLRATLTKNASPLEDAATRRRASHQWDCCLTSCKSKLSQYPRTPPFSYMAPDLIVP